MHKAEQAPSLGIEMELLASPGHPPATISVGWIMSRGILGIEDDLQDFRLS